MNVMRFMDRIICAIEDSGTLADITFRRIDIIKSGEVDELFGEREEDEKVYTDFPIRAHVKENPRENIYGPGGGEKLADLRVIFYGEQGYTPRYDDHMDWRGEKYEVTGTERIHPTGKDQQLGWVVDGKRY